MSRTVLDAARAGRPKWRGEGRLWHTSFGRCTAISPIADLLRAGSDAAHCAAESLRSNPDPDQVWASMPYPEPKHEVPKYTTTEPRSPFVCRRKIVPFRVLSSGWNHDIYRTCKASRSASNRGPSTHARGCVSLANRTTHAISEPRRAIGFGGHDRTDGASEKINLLRSLSWWSLASCVLFSLSSAPSLEVSLDGGWFRSISRDMGWKQGLRRRSRTTVRYSRWPLSSARHQKIPFGFVVPRTNLL